MKTFWTTFYSYKGSVGRSLALANIAALLVQRGRRVVLIDFDLETPGLASFDELKSIAGKQGVVEYVTEFERTKRAPEITQFIHPCSLDGDLRGKLWVMPAGKKDPAYNSCRASLDWVRLYESGLGEPFVENWKAAIARHCQPDYVFVDSRTGLTDVGGICTLHLPDLVVMMFGLNEQNVRGVAAVAKTIRESNFARLPQIHYVASPVPNLTKDKKSPLLQRWKAATHHLGAKIESSIHYQAIAALNERLFVLDPDLAPSSLVQDYQELLDRVIDYNRSGLDFLWRQTTEAIKESNKDLMERLIDAFQREFPSRPEALLARAQIKKALGDTEAAKALATQSLEADPTYERAFLWLLGTFRRDGDYQAALALCNTVAERATGLSKDRSYDLSLERGQSAMAAADYAIADKAYQTAVDLIDKRKRNDPDPHALLAVMFNATEARRRLRTDLAKCPWLPLTELFGKTGATTSAPLIIQANTWQAMHIAFAMSGDIERAREALTKSQRAAEFLGPAEDSFTVKHYTDVPVAQFIEINNEMLAALDKGQLWDGMPLPPAKPGQETPAEPPQPRAQ